MIETELPVNFPDPPYVAVITSGPWGSVVVVKLPVPFSNVTVPMTVEPRVSFTDPVGTPVNWGVTVIVNVTGPPKLEGFSDELMAVVLVAFVTVWEIAEDVLAAY